MDSNNVAIIFAAGVGERMSSSDVPKQFYEYKDKPLLIYTLEHFQRHQDIDAIILVTLRNWIRYCIKMKEIWHIDKLVSIVPGGRTSQESVYIGLKKAESMFHQKSQVLIHDGVRPLIDEKTISLCIQCVRDHASAITVSPQIETVLFDNGTNDSFHVIDRSRCYVARAPQCFFLRDILDVHKRAVNDGIDNFIDSATMMDHYGYILHTVMGPQENIKITTNTDLQVFQAIIDGRG